MLCSVARCATAVSTIGPRHVVNCSMKHFLRPYGFACSRLLVENVNALQGGKSTFEKSKLMSFPCSANQTRLFQMTSHLTSDKSTEVKQTSETAPENETVKYNQRQRLKLAVREYGATVVIFHTCISLFTLGVSYAAVSSGLDVVGLLTKLGVGQSILESKIATGASTFVIAYAAHKVFAPARMATTLAATPFIVRYLRRIGLLKRAASKP